MKKRIFCGYLLIQVSVMLFSLTWTYDFSNFEGIYNTNAVNTSFLPTPSSGTATVSIGTGGGSIKVENPGIAHFGSESKLAIQSPTNNSPNKFSLTDYTPANTFYTRFDFLIGTSTGGTLSSGIDFLFIQGNGSNFSNASTFMNNESFSVLRMTTEASSGLSIKYATSTDVITISTSLMKQRNYYTMEIVGNNSNALISYQYAGNAEHVNPQTYDLYLNGVLIGDDLQKAGLSANSPIDSWMFYSVNSASNLGHFFIDNITYANEVPAEINTVIDYHLLSGGILNQTNQWTRNHNHSGNHYNESFALNNRHYYIEYALTSTLNDHWAINYPGTKAILCDNMSLTIPVDYYIDGRIDLEENADLTIQNNRLPLIGDMSSSASINVLLNQQTLVFADDSLKISSQTSINQLNAQFMQQTETINLIQNIGRIWQVSAEFSSETQLTFVYPDNMSSDNVNIWRKSTLGSNWEWYALTSTVLNGDTREASVIFDGGSKTTDKTVSLSYWTVTPSDESLPVVLSFFDTQELSSHQVKIVWHTESENNLFAFYVLRSNDSSQVNALRVSELIEPNNESAPHTYFYIDEEVSALTEYYYWIKSYALDGSSSIYGPVKIITSDFSEVPDVEIHRSFEIIAYPNPFNPDLSISVYLSQGNQTELSVYNIKGQKVKTMMNQYLPKGLHQLIWEGMDDKNQPCPSGIYYVRCHSGKSLIYRKVMLLK